jgi:hypothetical protein
LAESLEVDVPFREVDRVLQWAAGEGLRKVGESAVRLGDRDAVVDRGVGRRERAAAVDLSPGRRCRPGSPGTVTWIAPAPTGRNPQAAAASPWLSTPPVASVAAIQRPSSFRTVWPTA